jgi:hypothetical protein
MNTKSLKPSFFVTASIVVVFASLRIAFPNLTALTGGFTSVGAIALFGGAMFSNKYLSAILPLLVLLVSDIAINFMHYDANMSSVMYSGWIFVYGSFALMAIASRLIMKRVTVTNTIIAAIVTTLIHWIVTDTAVWGAGFYSVTPMYTTNFAGLVDCHIKAIPFELRMLGGTLVYSALMFGIFEFIKKQTPALAYVKAK